MLEWPDVRGLLTHSDRLSAGRLTISTAELSHDGQSVGMDEFMGIPILTARVGGRDYRMCFDTGAQISYFQDDSLTDFHSADSFSDFYPGLGRFQTDTRKVPVSLGGVTFNLHCGTLPDPLGMTLTLARTEGILGNTILSDRTFGYFPCRRALVL